eukprot:3295141-Rhodomonas_salina.1
MEFDPEWARQSELWSLTPSGLARYSSAPLLLPYAPTPNAVLTGRMLLHISYTMRGTELRYDPTPCAIRLRKFQIYNAEWLQTLGPSPQTRDPRPLALDPGPETLDPRLGP